MKSLFIVLWLNSVRDNNLNYCDDFNDITEVTKIWFF